MINTIHTKPPRTKQTIGLTINVNAATSCHNLISPFTQPLRRIYFLVSLIFFTSNAEKESKRKPIGHAHFHALLNDNTLVIIITMCMLRLKDLHFAYKMNPIE